jgi:opacity protein-like surface antigen
LLDGKLSPGLQFTLSGWNRFSPSAVWTQHQFAFIFLAVTDYNFIGKENSKIMPFAGIGLGYSSVNTDVKDGSFTSTTKSHFACSPRIGMEFFKRIRLTGEYKYIGNNNSFFNIKLGFVIGIH